VSDADYEVNQEEIDRDYEFAKTMTAMEKYRNIPQYQIEAGLRSGSIQVSPSEVREYLDKTYSTERERSTSRHYVDAYNKSIEESNKSAEIEEVKGQFKDTETGLYPSTIVKAEDIQSGRYIPIYIESITTKAGDVIPVNAQANVRYTAKYTAEGQPLWKQREYVIDTGTIKYETKEVETYAYTKTYAPRVIEPSHSSTQSQTPTLQEHLNQVFHPTTFLDKERLEQDIENARITNEIKQTEGYQNYLKSQIEAKNFTPISLVPNIDQDIITVKVPVDYETTYQGKTVRISGEDIYTIETKKPFDYISREQADVFKYGIIKQIHEGKRIYEDVIPTSFGKGFSTSILEQVATPVLFGADVLNFDYETIKSFVSREKNEQIPIYYKHEGLEHAASLQDIGYSIGYATPAITSVAISTAPYLTSKGLTLTGKAMVVGKTVGGVATVSLAGATIVEGGKLGLSSVIQNKPITSEDIEKTISEIPTTAYKLFAFTPTITATSQIIGKTTAIALATSPAHIRVGTELSNYLSGLTSSTATFGQIPYMLGETSQRETILSAGIGAGLYTVGYGAGMLYKSISNKPVEFTQQFGMAQTTTQTEATATLPRNIFSNKYAVKPEGITYHDVSYGTQKIGIELNELAERIGVYIGKGSNRMFYGYQFGKGLVSEPYYQTFLSKTQEIAARNYVIFPVNEMATKSYLNLAITGYQQGKMSSETISRLFTDYYRTKSVYETFQTNPPKTDFVAKVEEKFGKGAVEYLKYSEKYGSVFYGRGTFPGQEIKDIDQTAYTLFDYGRFFGKGLEQKLSEKAVEFGMKGVKMDIHVKDVFSDMSIGYGTPHPKDYLSFGFKTLPPVKDKITYIMHPSEEIARKFVSSHILLPTSSSIQITTYTRRQKDVSHLQEMLGYSEKSIFNPKTTAKSITSPSTSSFFTYYLPISTSSKSTPMPSIKISLDYSPSRSVSSSRSLVSLSSSSIAPSKSSVLSSLEKSYSSSSYKPSSHSSFKSYLSYSTSSVSSSISLSSTTPSSTTSKPPSYPPTLSNIISTPEKIPKINILSGKSKNKNEIKLIDKITKYTPSLSSVVFNIVSTTPPKTINNRYNPLIIRPIITGRKRRR